LARPEEAGTCRLHRGNRRIAIAMLRIWMA
jgi:hypothetical protein